MKLYINVRGGKTITVLAKPNPYYKDEIIIGDERFAIKNGTYDNIKDNSELIISSDSIIIRQSDNVFYDLK